MPQKITMNLPQNITPLQRTALQLFATLLVAYLISLLWQGFVLLPETATLPMREWVTDFVKWIRSDRASFFGIFTVKEVTRSISFLISFPLKWSEYFLFRGFRGLGLPPLPWVWILISITILAHWIAGWRLALLCFLSMLYLAFFGLWQDSMKTLSIVLSAMVFASLLGLFVGLWANRSKNADRFITPMLDVMQATPHMAYLAPVFALFGAGQVAALIATVIFAMPPMARCVILGLQTVPDNITEAGSMSGCTKRQLLWKVRIPAARKLFMLGLNQVVMQTLAMAVIMSIVGAQGLGQKLLYALQQLRLGIAIELGAAIVLIAVMLDRLTQSYANRQTKIYHGPKRTLIQKHPHMMLFVASTILIILVVSVLPDLKALKLLPKGMTVSYGKELNVIVKNIVRSLYFIIDPIRDFITLYILIPIRNFYLSTPWICYLALIGYAGYRLGGIRLMLLVSAMLFVIVISNFWREAITTFYTVSIATMFCMVLGLPLGILATKSKRAAKVILTTCDILQTFPSFIYLLPAIMLLRVGDLAVIFAIIPYAMVPAIRYSYLGITRVPEVIMEAAIANGTTARQRLWKVQLPIAFPEIMLGVNQTIMMSLAMTAITALIGTTDLGQEIYRALAYQEYGRGILAGLWIAMIGMITDRLIQAWSNKRKREFGMA